LAVIVGFLSADALANRDAIGIMATMDKVNLARRLLVFAAAASIHFPAAPSPAAICC
jgi:hypothetical protein